MKVAILAGGSGTRLLEITRVKHKALVEIGDKPIICHIMDRYSRYGYDEFIVALGYKSETVREYFATAGYSRATGSNGGSHERYSNGRRLVDLVDTGEGTETGGRIKRLAPFLGDATFMLTWCDGLADIDLDDLLAFHRSHGKLATLTAVHPPARFGCLSFDGDRVAKFAEKAVNPDEWINGAFFVLEPEALSLIDGDASSFERDLLARLARAGELMAYRHGSFWHCMDTLAEAEALNRLWRSGAAPW